ncbi:DUF1353 domain-containing protein [Mesobacterium sp. TK19101]|uniref:DUF1353 domain-containing protein n=1 Tax=Mesobacterium hydrothermale TaxID=3111907 RepID=A0ABU6HK38_9RHOB|nr:DUF1353 domain-containing protein [Mesobacterium sp. TK19101]MEC3862269.1 DUF1353 domain-containing protein [Mesobacterium sp. TK19101]
MVRLRRRIGLALLAFAAVGAAYVLQPSPGETRCTDVAGADRCRFDGTPLDLTGAPVYLPGKEEAFLHTAHALRFVGPDGVVWTAPAGTLTDGATIPRFLEPLLGDRQSRDYVLAATLHDAYCGEGNEALPTYHSRPWPQVHRMLYDALRVNGTPPDRARIMFAAVYLSGPRWDASGKLIDRDSEARIKLALADFLRWAEKADPEIEAVEHWLEGQDRD